MHKALSGKGYVRFQSTLSMRRATDSTENVVRLCEISIHALHEESDAAQGRQGRTADYFNPRSP